MGLRSYEKTFLKYFSIFLVIVILGVYLMLSYLEVHHRELADEKLDEMRAAGYATTYEEIHERIRKLSEEENAAIVYREGFELYVDVEDEENSLVPLVAKHDHIDPAQKYSEETYDEIYVFLNRNQAALEKFYKGALLEDAVYIYDYSPGGELDISHVSSIRDATGLLCLDAEYALYQGDMEKAEKALLAAMSSGRTLSNDYGLIAQIVRVACNHIVLAEFERLVNQGELSEETLTEIKQKIDEDTPIESMSLGYQHEFIMIMDDFDNVWNLKEEFIDINHLSEMERTLLSFDFLAERDRYLYFNLIHNSINNIRAPYNDFEVNKTKSIQNDIATKRYNLVSARMKSSMTRVQEVVWRNISHNELMRIVCSIELYRIDNQKTPESLEEIAPEYLPSVPMDPYGGQPLHYKRTEEGYLVYGIGQDLEDDGGIQLETHQLNRTEGDWSIQVNR